MNIEIANRLVSLRKENHLSQEDLAAQIGVSRQAVSKWERAEASPDTDNLILLARLYKISLDELLKTEDIVESGNERSDEEIMEKKSEPEKNSEFKKHLRHFPYPFFITLVYLVLGFGCNSWSWGWILYLTTPIYYWIVKENKTY